MAPVAAWGIYELGLLAAAAISALFLASPEGQKVSKETSEALDRLLQKKKEDPEGKPKLPIPVPPVCVQKCPEEPKKCPVCGIAPDPVPSFRPPYLDPPRVPVDKETILVRGPYIRTNWTEPKGAKIWKDLEGNYYHRDTFHVGHDAEIEMYDKRENHLGAICPHCGTLIPGSKVVGRYLRKRGGG